MDEVSVDAIQAFPAKREVLSEDPLKATISNGFSEQKPIMDGVKYFSSQRAKALVVSPAHYHWKYVLGHQDVDTPAKELGRLMHWALLQPKEFLRRYVIKPSFEGKGAKERRDAWEASITSDNIVLTKVQAEKISHMITALNAHPRASKLLSKGTPEVHTFYRDHEFKDEFGSPLLWYGVMDFLRSGNWIVEVKTTKSAREKDFMIDFYKFGYHLQLYKYRRMVHGITGQMPNVAVIAVENVPPYVVEIFPVPQQAYDDANFEVTLALGDLREAVNTGVWRGYRAEETPLPPRPDWLKSRFYSGEEDQVAHNFANAEEEEDEDAES